MALPGGATDNDTLDPVGNLVGNVLVVGVQVKLSVGKVRRLQSCGKGRAGGDTSGRSSEVAAAGTRRCDSSHRLVARSQQVVPVIVFSPLSVPVVAEAFSAPGYGVISFSLA